MIPNRVTYGTYFNLIVDIGKVLPHAAAEILTWDMELLKVARKIDIKTAQHWSILPKLMAHADALICRRSIDLAINKMKR